MNIYFDIDGVLKGVDSPMADLVELVSYVLDYFPGHVFWLTSHCKGGVNNAIYALRDVFDEEMLDRMAAEIQPTDWGVLKTDAIDFSQPFCWLDDALWQSERAVLEQHDALKYHILMDWHDELAAKKALFCIKQIQKLNSDNQPTA